MKNGSGTRLLGIGMVMGLVLLALVFMAAMIDNWGRDRPELMFVGLLGEAFVFLVLMFGPVGRAIGSLLASAPESDDQMVERMGEMEERMAELSGEVQRLSEIEARVEFTERLLARPIAEFTRDGR